MRFGLIYAQPLEQPAKLLRCDVSYLIFIPGPLKASVFQPLIQQHKAVAFPKEGLDAIRASAAEQKQVA